MAKMFIFRLPILDRVFGLLSAGANTFSGRISEACFFGK